MNTYKIIFSKNPLLDHITQQAIRRKEEDYTYFLPPVLRKEMFPSSNSCLKLKNISTSIVKYNL